jgi:serine/threonine protein kinase
VPLEYYVWGYCKEENILIPIENKLKSFNEILVHYSGNCLEMSEKFIKFNDLFITDGFYEREFDEIEKIGEGSYGKVFTVNFKGKTEKWAIKKLSLEKEFKTDILRKMSNFSVVFRIVSQYVVKHRYSWLETNRTNDKITLYIMMDLCDKTLKQLMDQIKSDSNNKTKESLTQIGYYIASQLFIEILECVEFLHKNKIIHRDLNPYNIMIKKNGENNRFIKICDFGLIAIHKFAQQSHTQDRGHIKYAAPEVLDGRKYDLKADIYSLGRILQNLFDIDINWYSNNGYQKIFKKCYFFNFSSYEGNEIDSKLYGFLGKPLLLSKYKNALQLYKSLTQPIPHKRPNCEEILESKNKWALDKNELIIANDLRRTLEEKSVDKQKIYHIIYTKLNNP